MPGLFSRIKTWVSTEDVTYSDLNAEFDNVLTNFVPLMMDDYSTNVTQMQVVTDPGEVGTESLATTLAGELARLRQMLKEITGKDYWYETPVASLAGLSSAVGTTGFTANRLVSGRMRTDSDYPIFLVPNGAARTVKLDGTPVNFRYYVESTEYTISSDVTVTNLTAAPSTNNTCLINDTNAADQDWTKYAGEDGSEITVDAMGSEIQNLVGKYAAFSLNNGTTTEMFIAKVKSTTALTEARRGYFFDSSDTPQSRIVFSNNDTITLLKLSWIYAKSDGTLTVSYTNPVYDFDEPSSPAANDYWFDYANNKWRKYDVSSFIDADATLVGVCCQDTTNCIGARSHEFFKNWSDKNTIELYLNSNTQVISRWPGSVISVWGNIYSNDRSQWSWEMAGDLDTGGETGSTYYFAYVTEDGDVKLSATRPYDRREDLLGYYHPHHSWRCVGSVYNNGSSNFSDVESYFKRYQTQLIIPTQTAAYNLEVINEFIPLSGSGGAFSFFLPPAAYARGRSVTFKRTDNTPANAVTIDGFGSETIDGATTYLLYNQYDLVTIISDGTNWHITNSQSRHTSSVWRHTGAGNGSTNTRIREYTTTVDNLGTDITLATSSANGDSFTINSRGLYHIQMVDYFTAGSQTYGISLNSASLTTSIASLAVAERPLGHVLASTSPTSLSGVLRLTKNDVIRPHMESATSLTDGADNVFFRITKIGDY